MLRRRCHLLLHHRCLVKRLGKRDLPLGILIRRESKLASFAVAVLVFLALYSLLVGGEALAMEEKLPPRVALWGPDILMGAAGLGLLFYTFRR